MKKIVKWTVYFVYLVMILEIFSRVIIFCYLKRHLSPERFLKIFSKSNFFYCVGGLFSRESIYEYDLYELTHLKAGSGDVNEHGYRGEKVRIIKPKGTIRILCLGDSTTFGVGVPVKYSYPYLLQERLRKEYPYKMIEVINAGVPRTNSIEAKRRFQVKFMKYKPDIIIWRSDFELTDSFDLPQITKFDQLAYWLKIRIARSCLVNLMLLPLKRGVYFDYPLKPILVPEGVKSNYDAVKLLAAKIGAKVIPVEYIRKNVKTGQLISDFSKHKPRRDDFIETLSVFVESKHTSDSLLFDNVHLTEIGNEILAQAISNYLINKKLLEKVVNFRG